MVKAYTSKYLGTFKIKSRVGIHRVYLDKLQALIPQDITKAKISSYGLLSQAKA
jgi:hypothetical protein